MNLRLLTRNKMACLISLSASLIQINVHAQESEREQPTGRTNEIIVTATQSSLMNFEVPYMAEGISNKKLTEASYRTVPQMLREVPGVVAQETSHGQGSPYIRGFTGYHTLYMIDGIRLNNSVFRSGPNQYLNTVNPYSIDRMEVVKGPSSVLYGSDAIGGTINMFTQNPNTYEGALDYGGRLLYRVSTAENSHVGFGQISVGIEETTGILMSGTGRHYGDLIGGRNIGRQGSTGYDEYDTDFKLEHFLNDDTRLVMAHQRVRVNNAPRTHRTRDAISFDGTSIGSDIRRDFDQERELTYLKLIADHIEGDAIDELQLSLSYQRQSEIRDRIRSNSTQEFQGFDVDTVGITGQLVSNTSIGKLTYGLSFYHDNVNSFSSTNAIQGPVADDATYDLLGIFIQDEMVVTDRLNLILGGRYTYARADANKVRDPVAATQISLDEDWDAAVWSARFVYTLIEEELNLFGGVSQGFRTPNLSDLTRFDSARTNEFEVAAPGLDPEYYTTYEIGLKSQSEKIDMQFSYFYTLIRDQIQAVPTGVVNGSGDFEVTKRNVGDGQIFGIEYGMQYRFAPDWQFYSMFAWQEGEVNTSPSSGAPLQREYMSRLMPITAQLGVRWDSESIPVYIDNFVVITDDADKLSTRDKGDTSRIAPGGTDGYVTWSIRTGYKVDDNMNLHLTVDNITDEDYRVHGSGTNSPGRNLIFTLDFTF